MFVTGRVKAKRIKHGFWRETSDLKEVHAHFLKLQTEQIYRIDLMLNYNKLFIIS